MLTNQNKDTKHGSLEGVVRDVIANKNMPMEFITAAKSFEDALARCVIRDEQSLNDIILLYDQFMDFGMMDEIEILLTKKLIGGTSVGGFNRSLAAMTYSRIYDPQGAGVKSDKNTQKALMEIQRQRRNSDEEDQKKHDNES